MKNESLWFDCNVMLPGPDAYPVWAWKEGYEPTILHAVCPTERRHTHWTPSVCPPRPFSEQEKAEARHETHAKAEARQRDSIDAYLREQF